MRAAGAGVPAAGDAAAAALRQRGALARPHHQGHGHGGAPQHRLGPDTPARHHHAQHRGSQS